jgi:hypothetical protein
MMRFFTLLFVALFSLSSLNAKQFIDGAEVLNRSQVYLKYLDLKVNVYKLMDPSTGRIYEKAFDEEGREIDLTQLWEEESKIEKSIYGKLDKNLYEILKSASPDELINVTIWLVGPDLSDLQPRPENITKEEKRRWVDEVKERHVAITVPFAEMIRAKGFDASAGVLAPFVSAKLTPSEIKEIEKNPRVVKIYGPTEDQRFIDYGTTTERATFVWLRNIDGNGVKVCVHEDDGVSDANPYLDNSTHPVVYWKPGSPNVGSHATAVAGVIASTHSLVRGAAYYVDSILSANFQVFGYLATYDSAALWAIQNGADVINMSWGGCALSGEMNDRCRWVDYLVKTYWVNIVVAAGNTPNCGGDTHVSNPANAFNVIAVGSINDFDNGDWSDDVMSSFSQWENPVSAHNDREKPEVVALGEDVNMTSTSSPWVGYVNSGTSFAAPAVTGQVALLLDRNSSLFYWPEAVKAIIMASAFHNIEGDEIPNPGNNWTATDDRDGAGAVVMAIADSVAANGWFHTQYIEPSSFDPSGYIELTGVIPAVAGDTWRVVLCWDATASGPPDYTSDTLNADLDLSIYSPGGSYVTGSSSWDNSYEICQFVASQTGNYTIRVYRYRFDPNTYTYMAVAWARKMDVSPCSQAQEVADGDTLVNEATYYGSMFWDSYNITGWDESGRELVYKVNVPYDGMDLSATIFNNPYDVDVFILNSCNNSSAVAYGNYTAVYSNAPAGTYYIVVDGYYGAVSTFNLAIAVSGQPNLTHYTFSGWTYPVVPRDTTGTTPSYCPLPSELPGNDTTYLNMAGTNDGNSETGAPFTHRFYVDGVYVWWGTWTTSIQPGNYFYHPDAGPIIIKGGRHTIGDSIDVFDDIPESNENDNYYERQFVWSPLTIQKHTPVERTMPPTYGNGVYPNCDGFRFTRTATVAYGVAIASVTTDEDYDLRVYTDYSGSESGFSVLADNSYYGTGYTDFVVAAYSGTASTVYPAVTKYSGGNDNFYIDATDASGRLLSPPAYLAGETLPSHRLLNVYEVYLTAGNTYSFVLVNRSGNANLGFSLYGPDTGYYGRNDYLAIGNSHGAGGSESFTFTPSTDGWYVLAVYKNGSSDESLNAVYDLHISTTFLCGDVNGDGAVNTADLSYLASYLFFGGPEPVPYLSGDVNNDCSINTADLSYLASYLFFGGPSPNCCTVILRTPKTPANN